MEAAGRREVAAAQNVGGLVEVDVAVDVRGHAMRKAVGIVGDEQAHRDMRSLETLGKFDGGIAAYGVADRGDRLGVAPVIADRLVGDTAPHHVRIDVCRHAGAVDAPRQFVHPPIDKADQAAEQIGAPVRFGRRTLGGDTGEARCDQDGEDVSIVNQLSPPSLFCCPRNPAQEIRPRKSGPRKSRPTRSASRDLNRNRRSYAYAVSHNPHRWAGYPAQRCRRLAGLPGREGKPLVHRPFKSQSHLRLWQGLRSVGTAIRHSSRNRARAAPALSR